MDQWSAWAMQYQWGTPDKTELHEPASEPFAGPCCACVRGPLPEGMTLQQQCVLLLKVLPLWAAYLPQTPEEHSIGAQGTNWHAMSLMKQQTRHTRDATCGSTLAKVPKDFAMPVGQCHKFFATMIKCFKQAAELSRTPVHREVMCINMN